MANPQKFSWAFLDLHLGICLRFSGPGISLPESLVLVWDLHTASSQKSDVSKDGRKQTEIRDSMNIAVVISVWTCLYFALIADC